MVLVKKSLYKATGYTNLNPSKLEEILLDIKVNLNNHLLNYLEGDIAFLVLKPKRLILGQPVTIPAEDYTEDDENIEVKRQRRYQKRLIKKCKQSVWKRWNAEYLRGLRKHLNMKHKTFPLFKDGDRQGKWKTGIVDELYYGMDDAICAV